MSSFCFTAPAKPSATWLPCIPPCFLFFIGKKVEVSLQFFDIWKKNGFRFLMRKFGVFLGRLVLPTKLIGSVNLVFLVHLATSRMHWDKYFSRFIYEKFKWNFFYSSWFYVGSIKECIYGCLSMQIQDNIYSLALLLICEGVFEHFSSFSSFNSVFFLILNAINE